MEKQQHTPGPWDVVNDGDDPYAEGYALTVHQMVNGATGNVVALVPNDHDVDARLVAAAPDLLAAAGPAFDWLAEHGAPNSITDALGAAITKATAR